MKNIFFTILINLILVNFSFSQMVTMGDPGYPSISPIPCATFGIGATNFQDPGAAGNYPANYNDTIVFCPDLLPTGGSKVTIAFATNAGFSFDIDGSDFIYVYDGPSVASPLIGTLNSTLTPSGANYMASWSNPTGCLTVVFVSNGSAEGTGWLASVTCGNPPQPFVPHIEAFVNGLGANALNPIDTGFVDICFGDSILFVAKPIFDNSLETNGYGYSQNVNTNIDFDWYITDGGTYIDNDSIWFIPPARAGYLIDLKMTDAVNYIERIVCKVRVSQLPSFAGTGPVEDTVCLGQNTFLVGGVTPQDTVGISIPEGTFQLGGAFAGLTYLPDGSGLEYEAPITIGGFPIGSSITNAQDLNQVCITMEHSYLGDLEIWLECPNGTIVALVNSYSPGALPGGISGGGTFLGHPFDDVSGGGAGIGWEYCFSSVFNDAGTMMTEFNTLPVAFVPAAAPMPALSSGNSINPNLVYSPETSFADFTGCPVNGEWTIHVRDNLGTDDGFIFEWGLFFDPSFFPGLDGYQNTVFSEFWSPDPTIISGENDTLLVVQPNTAGLYYYTYNMVDDYGCPYDTVVSLFVQSLPAIFSDTIACDMAFQVAGTSAFNGGVWSSASSELTFSPSTSTENPLITASVPGIYTVTYTDVACLDVVTAVIDFATYPAILDDNEICTSSLTALNTVSYATGGVWSSTSSNISFSPASTTLNPTISASATGTYTVTFTDNVCNNSTDAVLTFNNPPSIFSQGVGCDMVYQVTNTSSTNGGTWSWTDTAIVSYSPNVDNTQFFTSTPGTYTVTYTDVACNQVLTAQIYFPPYAYTQVFDSVICAGTNYTIYAQENATVNSFLWNTGSTSSYIEISQPGDYIVTASNECYTVIDTATIETYICEINAPNIMVLSSLVGNNAFFVQYDGVETFECVILNRWGNKIYSYIDPAGKWDGRSNSGDFVEEGTYFYIIKAKFYGDEEETIKNGFVQVKY